MAKKISFTRSNKNVNDKFFDLLKAHTKIEITKKKVKRKNKNGKTYHRTIKVPIRRGTKLLARTLDIKESVIKNYIKYGVQKKDSGKINVLWRKGKFEGTKTQTIEYYNDSFTRENFFKYRKIRRLKKHEQYYFRCGIYLECVSNTNKNATYIIQNLPIPTAPPTIQTNNYKEGFDSVFDEIKRVLQSYPSIKLFRINYFDVCVINIDSGKFVHGTKSKQVYGPSKTKKLKTEKFTKAREKALRKKYND